MYVYIHAYIHTCIHTYIHVYIHTYIYVYSVVRSLNMASLFGYLIKKNHIQSIEAVQRRFTRFYFSYQEANTLSYHERLAILNLPPLYNRMVYLSISFVVKCLHGFYISYDILPKPSSRRAHYLTFTHEFARTNVWSIVAYTSFLVFGIPYHVPLLICVLIFLFINF